MGGADPAQWAEGAARVLDLIVLHPGGWVLMGALVGWFIIAFTKARRAR